MTSADVKFSIDEAGKATDGWGYINSAIKSITTPDESTVVITTKYPWSPLLADLSLFSNGIIPKDYGGKSAKDFYEAPVATGPFMWDHWTKGQELSWSRTPTTGRRASPTWTASPGRRSPTTTPASCSSRAARRRWTSSRRGPRWPT